MEVEDLLKYMLNFFQNIDKEIVKTNEELSKKDMELSDLDHYIEIHSLKSYELAKIGRLRKTLREERREIKNKLERLKEIKSFTAKYNNKMIQGDIIQLLKGLETINKRQEKPNYNYRTNILDRLEDKHEQVQQQENSCR